jgi:hypothetical protein
MDQADFPWRPLGLLLVDKGLVTQTELEIVLDEQRRTGRLLGQILVGSGSVTGLALAQALTEQHGVELRPNNGAGEPLVTDSQRQTKERPEQLPEPEDKDRAWRPLGKLLVATGFLSETQLESALAEQRQRSGRRLGEILVAQGSLSGPALAVALAKQHGLDLGTEKELDAGLQTVIKPSTPGQPNYRVREIVYEPTHQPGSILYESTNFLEAADFACEFVERRNPQALEIQKTDGATSETVWTYSEERAAAEALSRKRLVETFGFDPMRWDTRARFESDTKSPY